MTGRTVLLVLVVCGFAVSVVPDANDVGQTPAQVTEPTGKSPLNAFSKDQPDSSDWYSGSHTLQRQDDGHFYANAKIGGASLRMMVDTGASVVALTADDASAAGLEWDPSEVRLIGRGASGDVYGVATRIGSLDIGGFVRQDVSAVIIPEGLHISLLGQSYLSQIGSVEIADDAMIMDRK